MSYIGLCQIRDKQLPDDWFDIKLTKLELFARKFLIYLNDYIAMMTTMLYFRLHCNDDTT